MPRQQASLAVTFGILLDGFQDMMSSLLAISWSEVWGVIKQAAGTAIQPWNGLGDAIGKVKSDLGGALKSAAQLDLVDATTGLRNAGEGLLGSLNRFGGYLYLLLLAVPNVVGLLWPGPGTAAATAVGQWLSTVIGGVSTAVGGAISSLTIANGLRLYDVVAGVVEDNPDIPADDAEQVLELLDETKRAQVEQDGNNVNGEGFGIGLSLSLIVLGTVGRAIFEPIKKWLKQKFRALKKKKKPKDKDGDEKNEGTDEPSDVTPEVDEPETSPENDVPDPDAPRVRPHTRIPDFDQFQPGQGFSGVYDPKTGAVRMRPSVDSPNPPSGWVRRRGGHSQVRDELSGLGVDTSDVQGFTGFIDEAGNLRLEFESGLNTPRRLPENLQGPLREAVRDATGRTVQ